MNPSKPTCFDFFEFIYDRQLIWYNRFVNKLEPEYWTDDPIFKNNRFCNVYRELDRCSIHLIDWVINNKSLSLEDKIFNILLYRRFNTPWFFQTFGVQRIETYDWKSLEKKMDVLKKHDVKLFNSAYIICQRYFTDKYRKHDKHVQQLLLMNNLIKNWDEFCFYTLEDGASIEALHEVFVEGIPMTGDFLAYQYCTDISYLPELKGKFEDINDFVAMGPGSKPGIDLLFPTTKLKRETNCKLLYERQKLYFEQLKIRKQKDWNVIRYKYAYNKSPYLSLSNIQNCLCEFRKYCNLQTIPGKRRRKYVATMD